MEYIVILALSIAIIIMGLVIAVTNRRIRKLKKDINKLIDSKIEMSIIKSFQGLFGENEQPVNEKDFFINKLKEMKATGWSEDDSLEDLRKLYNLLS